MKHLTAYAAGLLALMIAGFVVLAVTGRPTTDYVAFMGVLLGQAATGVTLLLKLNKTDTKVNDIQDKVNGRMTELIAAKTIPDNATVVTDGSASPPAAG